MVAATPTSRFSRFTAVVAVTLGLIGLPACLQFVPGGQDPVVTIDAPRDGATVSTTILEVRGSITVDGPVAVVDLANTTTGAVTQCTISDRRFTCRGVALADGANMLVATVVDGRGRTARDSALVTYAAGAASLVITSPASAGTSPADAIDVEGTTAGFGAGLTVQVDNGASRRTCTVTPPAFRCPDVPLVSGDNFIVVTGRDAAGRTASDAVFVAYEAGSVDTEPPSVTITSPGDGFASATSYVTVEANVTDDSAIRSVEALSNGVVVPCAVDPSGSAAACTVFLLAASQTVEVRAVDEGGLEGSDAIVIDYAPAAAAFDIDLAFFDAEFSASQLAAFEQAVDVWEAIVVGDLQDVSVDFGPGDPALGGDFACGQGEPAFAGTIDDLRVYVTSGRLSPGVLGVAGPCRSRVSGQDPGTNLVGFMEFSIDFVGQLEADGQLVETIVHELGHVLGFGTNWEYAPYFDLLAYEPDTACGTGAFSVPPTYTGPFARTAYERLGGRSDVPVEEGGGAGTRCGHWDEDVFGNELMTGFLNGGTENPLSELTAAALLDLGLDVDLSASEPYTPPTGLALRGAGLDLAQREVLLRPIGTVDATTGRVGTTRTPSAPWRRPTTP